MINYNVYLTSGELFQMKSEVQIYEGDCFVIDYEGYYVSRRDGNTLYSKVINKTVAAYR